MSHRTRRHHRQESDGHGGHASHRAETGFAARQDYTLGHAGRQVRVGPVAFWTFVGTLVIMASWSIATATYFAFQDDLLTRLIGRQAEMQYAYEDRIADLRAQVDRLASRQLLDQEQYEQKLDQIVRRQMLLESRAASIAGADPTPTGSIRGPARPPSDGPGAAPVGGKSSAINDTVILVPAPEREARLESRNPVSASARMAAKITGSGLQGALPRLHASLDRVESAQTTQLASLEAGYQAKARRIRGVLAELGLDVSKIEGKSEPAKSPARGTVPATGGPYIPADIAGAGAFERHLYRISVVRAQADRLTRALVSVPIRRPMNGDADTTSGFGMRIDPFLRSPAMHTGLDFRGDHGEAVRATAAGTVSHAGWNGGYGKMVEIEHGNGFTTRYAHLSAIDVEAGQSVRIGQIVGRLGSTGRSTGPHLHYETRVDGEAVDPQKFLRAGIRLGSIN